MIHLILISKISEFRAKMGSHLVNILYRSDSEIILLVS